MDVNLRLFSERLKRVLAGEEGTLMLPDSTNLSPHFQNILLDVIVVLSLLWDYEGDINRLLIQLWSIEQCDFEEDDVDRPDILSILKDINYFVHESEKTIDTFFISIMQQQNSGTENGSLTCEALLGLQSKIINIRSRMQQLPPNRVHVDISAEKEKKIQTEESDASSSSEFKKRDKELLLDLLIEGQDQLSVVAVLDSSGFDKTVFAAEAYNSNYLKYYFDCRAWVTVSIAYNFSKILDDIMKSVMPASVLSDITGEDYELKKTILHDYLTNKKYLIVLDDVCHDDVWDDLRQILPDCRNGSRVLITVTDIGVLDSIQFENKEIILFDSVSTEGPLIRSEIEDWPSFILYFGSKSLDKHRMEMVDLRLEFLFLSLLELPFHLKVCCFYLCIFPAGYEISTRQFYQLWVAEGLIPHNNEKTAEDYLNELINRGFIQVNKRRSEGTIKACSISSKVWVTLIGMAKITQFVKVRGIDFLIEETSLSIFDKPAEFYSSEHSDTYLHFLMNSSSVKVRLTLQDCEKFCKMFKLLRVLNLGSLVLDQCPSGIEDLFHLRYLKLNIPSIKGLPSSLCSLRNLYTLDMPSSYIDNTPEEIWKMHKLMHLNFGCITLPAPPEKFCSSLKNLIFISALHPSSCTPDIFSGLANIQTLRIYGDLSYYQSRLSKSLCKLLKLECLKLVNETKVWQLSQVVLSEYQFPPSLTQMSLSNTELKDDPMPTLEKLPHLQVLKLKQNSYSGRKLVCVGSGGFPQLKILHLKSMYWLEEWTMGSGAMPKLESLIINPCAYLKKLPEELYGIESLCKLELHWPQPELRKRLRAFEDMEQKYDIHIYPYGI